MLLKALNYAIRFGYPRFRALILLELARLQVMIIILIRTHVFLDFIYSNRIKKNYVSFVIYKFICSVLVGIRFC